ncbi:hypothetical protein [Streptomyces sp. MAR4 CNX-425]|uniref:hypothetical protein n=1 Tax=Streptomyces sp. MAR4 CNX-425 TaxID=3406343 RepID=UPI003B4FFC10
MRRLLWLVAAALLAAGCSTASGGEAAGPRPVPLPLGGAADFTAGESALLHRAEELGVRACMRDRGFAYRPVPPPAGRRGTGESPYGLLSVREAAQDGYGMTGARLRPPPPDPNASRLDRLPAAERREWERALKGDAEGPAAREIGAPGGPKVIVPTDSCVFAARKEVYGPGWEERYLWAQSLRNEVVRDTLAARDVRRSVARWSDCMREHGHDFAALDDGPRVIQRKLDRADRTRGGVPALRAAGRAELALAERDARCQSDADLTAAVAAAQRRREAALPGAQTGRLAVFREARDRALARAADMSRASHSGTSK